MKFLIVTYVRKANGLVDELIEVSKRVRSKDVSTANIILDFANKKVVKCVVDRQVLDTDWERLYDYFKTNYPSVIERLERESQAGV